MDRGGALAALLSPELSPELVPDLALPLVTCRHLCAGPSWGSTVRVIRAPIKRQS